MSNALLLTQLGTAVTSGAVRVVDLSVTLNESTPILHLPEQFNQSWPFHKEEISRYDERGPAWYWNNLSLGEHTGTHFDAPVHWVSGKALDRNATDTIDPRRFVAPACVIDCAHYAAADEDFLLEPKHVLEWEEQHGRIPANHWVFFHTGWAEKTDPGAFLNMREDGAHTPGPTHETAVFLAEQRDVLGFGTETVGQDAGQAFQFDPPFPCHAIMHGHNKFGLASLTNLDALPATGTLVIAAPLKIEQGSGSPCRVLALVA